MPRYGEAAQKSVERAMKRRNQGTLKSGRSGKTVRSREQAIAIGLSEARKKGAKVPPGPVEGSTKMKSSARQSDAHNGQRARRRSHSAGHARTHARAH